MSELEAIPKALPVFVSDIFRLVDDAKKSRTAERTDPGAISFLTGVMSEVCDRAEKAVQCLADIEMESAHANAVENRLLGLQDSLSSMNIPQCLEWTILGHDTAALSPAVLRGGEYYERCDAPASLGIFVRALVWRYLATRFAFHRAARLSYTRNIFCDFGAIQKSVVTAAKTQRRMLELMQVQEMKPVGELVALTVQTPPDSHDDGHLVSVVELSDGAQSVSELVDLARHALVAVPERRINHTILMADSVNSANNFDIGYSVGNRIHLVGNPDEIRFIIVLSHVPDHSEEQTSQEIAEPRFRLSKSRLRDAFWATTEVVANQAAPAVFHDATLSDSMPAIGSGTNTVYATKLESRELKLSGSRQDQVESESVISRSRIARAFFGYRGLSGPRLQ